MMNIWMNGIMGVVVGDALGLPVQFAPRSERDADPVTDMRGHGVFDMPVGSWSDDSSLTLAGLDALVHYGYDQDRIMQNFVAWLKEGEFTPLGFSYDIGGACFDSITEYSWSHNWKTCGRTGENENGNGFLMRIMPFCLYCYCEQRAGRMTDKEAIALIREASAFTHAHERSRIACVLYYFIVRSILDGKISSNKCLQRGLDDGFRLYSENGGDLEELAYYNRLRDLSAFKDVPRDEISGSGYVLHSLEAAVWSLLNTYNYEDAVLMAVNLGLDTDTTAAITGGLAGLIYGDVSIPKRWRDQILKKEMIEEMCNMAASKFPCEDPGLEDDPDFAGNGKLDELIHEFHEKRDKATYNVVMNYLMELALKGGRIFTPFAIKNVEAMDFAPLVIRGDGDLYWLPLYTDSSDIEAADRPVAIGRISIGDAMKSALGFDEEVGIVINPYREEFSIDHETVKRFLKVFSELGT